MSLPWLATFLQARLPLHLAMTLHDVRHPKSQIFDTDSYHQSWSTVSSCFIFCAGVFVQHGLRAEVCRQLTSVEKKLTDVYSNQYPRTLRDHGTLCWGP